MRPAAMTETVWAALRALRAGERAILPDPAWTDAARAAFDLYAPLARGAAGEAPFLFAQVGQSLMVPKAHAEGTIRWESLCVDQQSARVGTPEWTWGRLAADDSWNATMNRYGAEGWEPFHVYTHPTNNEIGFVCFRRPL